nr:hypothetical protein [Tanacetum cinerariifolium]
MKPRIVLGCSDKGVSFGLEGKDNYISDKEYELDRTEPEVMCRHLDHVNMLGLNKTTFRLCFLINWLVTSFLQLRLPGSNTEDGVPLSHIYGPKIKYERGAAVAFNIRDRIKGLMFKGWLKQMEFHLAKKRKAGQILELSKAIRDYHGTTRFPYMVHHGANVRAFIMKTGVPSQEDAEGNAAERYRGDESVSSTATSLASPVHPSSPSSASLRTRVKLWSLSNGVATNVVVHVQGSSFNLHKDPLTRCSRYLKRHLMESLEITISPPLKITSHTFTLVVDYCYGGHLFITPFNVASLILASELLEMTVYSDNIENLRQKTETYFCRTVVVDRDYATVVLKSCIGLLPDVETRTGLVSRCIEALSLNHDVGDDVLKLFDGVQELSCEEFRLLIGEEQQSKISNYIDCSNLSPQVLMHAVQNPRMPLRFVVQAMFIEQLNTRRSVFTATQTLKTQRHHHPIKPPPHPTTNSVTLGAILQRDAALRQVAHLKVTMDYTSSRIQSLEEEINGMRKILVNKSDTSQLISGRVKSESFRFSSERAVERGQRGSVSSGSFRVVDTEKESDYSGDQVSPRRLGKRVMNRLKSAFRLSGLGRNRDEIKVEKKSN